MRVSSYCHCIRLTESFPLVLFYLVFLFPPLGKTPQTLLQYAQCTCTTTQFVYVIAYQLTERKASEYNERERSALIHSLPVKILSQEGTNQQVPSQLYTRHAFGTRDMQYWHQIYVQYSILYGMCTISANFPRKNVHVVPVDVYGCRAELTTCTNLIAYVTCRGSWKGSIHSMKPGTRHVCENITISYQTDLLSKNAFKVSHDKAFDLSLSHRNGCQKKYIIF